MPMNEPLQPPHLTDDQQARITATLMRIRAGLGYADRWVIPEPVHVFSPRMQDIECR